MDKPFFIMLLNQRGTCAMPIVDEEGDVMFYASHDEAKEAMRGHVYAEAFGFEVFEMGNGL